MHYACIAPTAYLDQYAGRGHFQLCLAQVAMRDPVYFEWYKRRREAGDFVILDNGAYEGELVTLDDLTRVANELKPQVITVPDKINDAVESAKLAQDFRHWDTGSQHQFRFSAMRVYQNESRDPRDWMRMLNEDPQNWKWIAFPRVLGEDRLAIIRKCQDLYLPHIHAFGWTGNLNEVRALAKLGVTSIDTSAPVWRGMMGFPIRDTIDNIWESNGPKFDPAAGFVADNEEEHVTIPSRNYRLVEDNLQAMQRACVAF